MQMTITMLLLAACGRAPEPPPAPPVEAEQGPTAFELIHPQVKALPTDPVGDAAMVRAFPALGGLEPHALSVAVGVMNLVPGPCEPCGGRELARCAIEAEPGCENLPRLVDRAARLAVMGRPPQDIREALSYGDLWFQVPTTPDKLSVDVWVLPGAPFMQGVVDIVNGFDDPRLSVRLHCTPTDPEQTEPCRGLYAADEQGLGLPWLQASLSRGVSDEVPGLDVERWRGADESARIDQDRVLAERLGVRAAPTWFIGGYRLRGAQSGRAVRRLVALQLQDVEAR